MKKTIFWLVGIAAMLSAMPMMAEETANTTPPVKHEKIKGKEKGKDGQKGPFAGLDLTQEQREQLLQLRKEGQEAHEKLRKEMQEKIDALMDKQLAKAKTFLTAEQYQKFEAIVKQKFEAGKKRMQDRPGKGPGHGPGNEKKSDLQ